MFEEIANTVGQKILNVAVAVLSVLVLGGLSYIGLIVYKKKVARYKQFTCNIWQKDGFGQITEKYDQAGIFVDDYTKNKRLWLKKANVGLSPDNIPFITTGGGRKKVYLLQTGLKNFKYIKPNVGVGLINFTVGEEDVNWAINTYERGKKLFSQTWLAQYLPFIILAFVCLIILVLFTSLFKQIPAIKGLVEQLVEVAKYLAQAKTGTTVIT